jgi:riboflavin kinase/FMN adenylyltransferase
MGCHVGWDGFQSLPPRSTRVTWGVFDGVHAGHQAVLDDLAAWARREGAVPVVLTFDPHPQVFLRQASIPLVLPVAERARLIAARGIEAVVVAPFDRALASMPAPVFFEDVLLGRLGAGGILMGYDSRFGHNGEGTLALLRGLAGPRGVAVRTTEPRMQEGQPVKSSRLREAIADGDLDRARAMMGRPVCLVGPVVEGDRRGRTLGFPTANVACDGLVLPPAGVYAVRGWERPGAEGSAGSHESGPFDGVMNIGVRPTFGGGGRVSVEVHVLDLPAGKDLYGRTMRIEIVARLRGEMRFPDAASLQAQIAADCGAARAILSAARTGG